MYIYFESAQKTQTDAKLIMSWRNDPQTLENFYDSTPKKWPAFWKEYQKDYFNSETAPQFAKINGKRLAFLRSQPYQGKYTWDVDINLDPAFRGKGLGGQVLHAYAQFLFARGIRTLVAEIKIHNNASIRAFEIAGFRFKDKKLKHVRGQDFEILRMEKKAPPLPKAMSNPHVFVIAEAGSNWRMGSKYRDLAMAKTLIEVAKESGADAVKFQTYQAKTVYVPNAGKADYLSKSGEKRDITEIFDDLSMPKEMIPELASFAQACEIEFMSTPFSVSDFKALNPYVQRHKLASYEIAHFKLLDQMAISQKPIIMSTGGSTLEEIAWSVARYMDQGGNDLTLLQCTAKYPAPPSSLNLRALTTLAKHFGVTVGFSDHSRHPTRAPIAAVALGASVIEKHFTIDNRLPGPDHAFALVPKELKEMVHAIRMTELSLGSGIKKPIKAEKELRSFALRSLQATKSIRKGETFRLSKNFDVLRSGEQTQGLHPRFADQIQGKKAKRSINIGDGIQFDDFA